jgi:8-oxo-dGTP pyrophosphatase MutT (NUDIX family)
MRAWRPREVETLFSHRIFHLERHSLEAGEDRREAMVLRAPDWVNVIALDEEERVLLVRQWRFGIGAPTLEIPGGMIDDGESDRQAAERELYEETGHRARTWRRLGEVLPNPAFLANRCATRVATGLERLGEPPGDGEEELVVERAALADIGGLIGRGEISHALVIAAFYLLQQSPQSPS